MFMSIQLHIQKKSPLLAGTPYYTYMHTHLCIYIVQSSISITVLFNLLTGYKYLFDYILILMLNGVDVIITVFHVIPHCIDLKHEVN